MADKHPITRDDANDDIRRYLKMVEDLQSSKVFNQLPADVQSYFEGKLISFAFYKKELDALYASALDDPNALRVYLSIGPDKKPTIVITACKISDDEKTVTNRLPKPPVGGDQYPVAKSTGYTSENFDIGKD